MKIYRICIIIAIFAIPAISFCRNYQPVILNSTDSLICLKISNKDKKLKGEISVKGKDILDISNLGLISDQEDFSKLQIIKTSQKSVKDSWQTLFGKNSLIENYYEELNISTQTEKGWMMNVTFRIYNDGIAFRYEVPAQKGFDSLSILTDQTRFHFAEDFLCRAIDLNVETSAFEEKPISKTTFSKMPLLLKTPHCWMAINEAAVFDFSEMYLKNASASTTLRSDIGVSNCSLPLKTPWRVIQVGKKAGNLIESNILVNLNEPCKIEDPSWIKPGKAMWDWRNHGDTINGFVYGINEASYKRFIDFASENGIKYVVFDAGWNSKKGPQFPRENLDMPEIIKYARTRNVGIMLYIDRQGKDEENNWDMDEVLNTFSQWGAVGVKYGFLELEIKDRKTFVDRTRKIVELCAKYRMLVDFHDNPIHPGGEERTWPNRICIEYCHAQQDSRKSFNPSKAVLVPFINGLCGPLDMANGFYDLEGLQNRVAVDKKGLNSTVVGETARCLVNYSPLLILPDNPDEYNKKADLFRFIKEMPDTWDETKIIDGVPGEYIIVARRTGKNWFLAGNTNEQARTVDFPLNFLEKGSYKLTRYQDSKYSHYQKNKESYQILNEIVSKNDIVNVPMAPGGGFCMQLKINN